MNGLERKIKEIIDGYLAIVGNQSMPLAFDDYCKARELAIKELSLYTNTQSKKETEEVPVYKLNPNTSLADKIATSTDTTPNNSALFESPNDPVNLFFEEVKKGETSSAAVEKKQSKAVEKKEESYKTNVTQMPRAVPEDRKVAELRLLNSIKD